MALGVAAYYHWVSHSKSGPEFEVKYVISPSLDAFDSPAEVHEVVAILKNGDRVEILSEAGDWSKIRMGNGSRGWVLSKELLDSRTYQEGQKLLKQVSREQVQAVAHTSGAVNVHLSPSRQAAEIGMLTQGDNVDVFDRRTVERVKPANGTNPSRGSPPTLEAWYLVRGGSCAGWVLGRLVNLDVPPEISQYTQEYNMVAWFVLNTVEDGGRKVPQYLVADRVGSREYDFTHIRVFTWWVKQHHYVTAYAQSNLKGSFPIRVEHVKNIPYFRLRLVDAKGNEFQKVYGLFNTIVRPVGSVEGWQSNAMPEQSRRLLRQTPKRHR